MRSKGAKFRFACSSAARYFSGTRKAICRLASFRGVPGNGGKDMNRVLIAGVGNIFLGDYGFGVGVAARLRRRKLPQGVRVVDFANRGIDLAYALAEDLDADPRGVRCARRESRDAL